MKNPIAFDIRFKDKIASQREKVVNLLSRIPLDVKGPGHNVGLLPTLAVLDFRLFSGGHVRLVAATKGKLELESLDPDLDIAFDNNGVIRSSRLVSETPTYKVEIPPKYFGRGRIRSHNGANLFIHQNPQTFLYEDCTPSRSKHQFLRIYEEMRQGMEETAPTIPL